MSMLTTLVKHELGLPEDTPGKDLIPEVLEKLGEKLDAHADDYAVWIDMAVPLPGILEQLDGPAIQLALHGIAAWLKAQGAEVATT